MFLFENQSGIYIFLLTQCENIFLVSLSLLDLREIFNYAAIYAFNVL